METGDIVIAGVNLSSVIKALPIASRVFKPRELLAAGILTRMGSGLLRIEENIPTANRKPLLTREEKYSSLFERIFMEPIGIIFQGLTLYFTQEGVSKALENSTFLKPPTAKSLHELPIAQRNYITKAIKTVYAPGPTTSPTGVIAKQIYDRTTALSKVGNVKRLVANYMGKRGINFLPQNVIDGVDKLLMGYQRKLWVASAATLGIGVLTSAICSGYILQWLNDHVISKKVNPLLLKKFGVTSTSPSQKVFLPGPLPVNVEQRTFRI